MKLKKYLYKKVESTNNVALRLIKQGNQRGIILTDQQTKGKGQRKNKWISIKGNLFLSVFFEISKKISLSKIINLNLKIIKNDIYFHFDKLQISRCFNNLIKNAIEAVDKIPNPIIEIRLNITQNIITIEIIDNGVGIDDKMSGKIFEPYFTTKSKGTGLGLSIVKRIIEDHGGKIKIEKNKNMAGTTASVKFNYNE